MPSGFDVVKATDGTVHIDEALYSTLAESRSTTYDDGTTVILQGGCQNLTGGSRVLIHQYYERAVILHAAIFIP